MSYGESNHCKNKKYFNDCRKRKDYDDDCYYWEKKKCDEKKDKSKSAFRATNLVPQDVPVAFNLVKVLFQMEEFDLGNEYNPASSTFTAKEDGIYSFSSAVQFNPTDFDVDYEVIIALIINGVFSSGDVDYTGFNASFLNVVEVNDIFQLKSGDRVEVFIRSSTPGTIPALTDASTRFAGVRVQ
ncbi:C1q-like domain-containing protein [Bacillus cereus group sp. TH160LC]|uniref:C1q-like domain-containing protein n=1 Tax=Bacillus cereus group sp. TH160LC TaxID=3018058 RepID=UPI0022E092BA|nr:hypothetical protein [Bacillus cereus group sp. TH160LC]MDA1652629.1 hypothetical protein [Bacillus cereus group sp. TH160LC]